MRLPNPERAVVELSKLADYCLNPEHPDGKHKARVFAAALGVARPHAAWLRAKLLDAAFGEARHVGNVRYGRLYVIDFRVETPVGSALIRSGWIVREEENFPRLTTCFVTKD